MKQNTSDYISSGKTAGLYSGGGPFLAKVIGHLDPTYMGTLEVELLRNVGNSGHGNEGQLHQVKMMTPFYGVTSTEFLGKDPDNYNNTQKSYGMWFVPPDVGTTVIVIFIDGDAKRGYWIGCVPDEAMNFMIPGLAATQQVVDKKVRAPVAEYNKAAHEEIKDPTVVKKPSHPFANVLENQGLLADDIRGITTSSARREVPSTVFGISTPGPVDKRQGAKQGKVGKKEHKVDQVYVSRLGGSSFVMDDGDDKVVRKTHAKKGPPVYVDAGTKGSDPTIPHNEMIRLRTRTGHQILMHNSEDLIYIGNARGTAWIELTSNGKIDIFSQDSISIHTLTDLNITADRDINFVAGRNFNLNTNGNSRITAKKEIELYADKDVNISALANFQVKVSKTGKITVGGNLNLKAGGALLGDASAIRWNSGGAASATEAQRALYADRIPLAEPWSEHENLDPTLFTADKTQAKEKVSAVIKPAMFGKYTRVSDPFLKIKGT